MAFHHAVGAQLDARCGADEPDVLWVPALSVARPSVDGDKGPTSRCGSAASRWWRCSFTRCFAPDGRRLVIGGSDMLSPWRPSGRRIPLTNLYNRSAIPEYFGTGFLAAAVGFAVCAAGESNPARSAFLVWMMGVTAVLAVGSTSPTAVMAGIFFAAFGTLYARSWFQSRPAISRVGLAAGVGVATLGALALAPWVYLSQPQDRAKIGRLVGSVPGPVFIPLVPTLARSFQSFALRFAIDPSGER